MSAAEGTKKKQPQMNADRQIVPFPQKASSSLPCFRILFEKHTGEALHTCTGRCC